MGRKQYGGQNTCMPIKVNMSGVLPIIFASTFLAIRLAYCTGIRRSAPFISTMNAIIAMKRITTSGTHADVYKRQVPEIPGITIEVPAPNKVIVKGADKQAVGQFAAEIREKRPPEPYKGKGIKYVDEVIIRKEGKAGKGK